MLGSLPKPASLWIPLLLLLKKLKAHKIIIAGHTDNVPEKGTGLYESNWDLSAARAITVMNYLINKKIISEQNAAIQAYADTQPKSKQ